MIGGLQYVLPVPKELVYLRQNDSAMARNKKPLYVVMGQGLGCVQFILKIIDRD